MRGYKAFERDMTCRGFQYKIGETYTHDGEIGLCENGFHFCLNPKACFGYYPLESRLCEVEVLGYVTGYPDEKMVTDKIRIIREVPEVEKCRMFYSNGYGDSYSDGYGNGNGNGYGDGYGNGSGDGYSFGFGVGFGVGFGYSNGYGNGGGYGYGDNYGDRNNIYKVLILGGKK